MKSILSLSLALLVFAMSPVPAQAVLPPDLVFSAGVQLVQFFAIFAIAIGSVFSQEARQAGTRVHTDGATGSVEIL